LDAAFGHGENTEVEIVANSELLVEIRAGGGQLEVADTLDEGLNGKMGASEMEHPKYLHRSDGNGKGRA
jgi:hypothetical protein